MIRRSLTALALTGAAALAAAPALAREQLVRGPQKKQVAVFDNYYLPAKLTVNRASTISWSWTDQVADEHDVKVIKAPQGEKRFQSLSGSAGYVYKRTLRTPGIYRFICTFHEADGMVMTITVRK